MIKMNLRFFLVFFLILLFSHSFASPIGVGVNPAELSFSDSFTQILYVINTGEAAANYSLFSDNSSINFSEDFFSLEPSNFKEVKVFLVNPERSVSAVISVVASNDETNVNTGIRVPVSVVFSTEPVFIEADQPISNLTGFFSFSNIPVIIGLILIVLVLFSIGFMKFRQRKWIK